MLNDECTNGRGRCETRSSEVDSASSSSLDCPQMPDQLYSGRSRTSGFCREKALSQLIGNLESTNRTGRMVPVIEGLDALRESSILSRTTRVARALGK